MNPGAWISKQRERPIAEHERRTAMATVAVLLCAATLLLSLTQPAAHHRHATHDTPQALAVPMPGLQRRAPGNPRAPFAAQDARVAGRFLAGYLAYIYGHAPASAITGATPALLRSLQANPPRVSPGMRTRWARVLSLHTTPAAAVSSG